MSPDAEPAASPEALSPDTAGAAADRSETGARPRSGFWREVHIPDGFEKGVSTPVRGRVTLPATVAWSGQGELDLDDPADRKYAYEILLAEGTTDDILTYVDLEHLVESWDSLHIAPHVREQWGAWLRSHGLIA